MAGPVEINISFSPLDFVEDDETNLCFPVTLEHNGQRREIDQRKNVLRPLNISSLVREAVQLLVDPDMCAGIHKRTCAANDLFVVSFALEVDLNLLHVCTPIDFGVCSMSVVISGTRVLAMGRTSNFVNNDTAKPGICD
jgi:hypothetical protein